MELTNETGHVLLLENIKCWEKCALELGVPQFSEFISVSVA